jgi:hypothetical protein
MPVLQDRNLTRGAGIDAFAPPPIGVSGPFCFAVRFKPRNNVAIDPDSVRVTYRRNPEVELARFRGLFTAIAGQVSSWRSLAYSTGDR